jgi:ribonuclease Z
MRLIFLGTSAGAPTKSRNVTAIALQWIQLGKIWLFDCGEGTQHQFHRAPINISKVDSIFITHMHGDHVFGLPGLMASRSAAQGSLEPLALYGPEPLNELLQQTLDLTHTRIKYPWTLQSIKQGIVLEDDQCTVECRLLNHGIPSYGYSIVEKAQPGEFLPEAAMGRGVRPGPDFAILKSGEDILLDDGSVVYSSDVVGPPRRSRKIVICGDTGVTDATVELARDADVLVHEATFMAEQTERAVSVGHSTTVQAAEAARNAGVKQLILTHFSPRYEQQNSEMMSALLAEAQSVFPNTVLAEDFLVQTIMPQSD